MRIRELQHLRSAGLLQMNLRRHQIAPEDNRLLRQTLDPQVTTLLEQIRAQAAAPPTPKTPLSQQEEIAQTRQFMATLAQLAIASESAR